MLKNPENRIVDKNSKNKQLNFEARQNAIGFFDLLFKIAVREKIDIGQFNNNQNINNEKKND